METHGASGGPRRQLWYNEAVKQRGQRSRYEGWQAKQGDDAIRDACGVCGIFAPGEDVARSTFFALYSLQHRGQESAGLAVSDGVALRCHKDMGLISQIFTEEMLESLPGHLSVGHTRY